MDNMAITRELKHTKRTYRQDKDPREKLFYLFLIAQICAIFCMVVGVLFFILRILTLLN
jgi:hypothetical protein